jgi:di/tricarboxylate transporter
MERIIRSRYNRLVLLNTAMPGILSGFISIVASAAFFIPVILRLCRKMKVPQSRILLPMAFTALIGANLSLIGASHNLVVNSLLERSEGYGFGFFEFTVVGAVLLAAALLYNFFPGPALLPGGEEAPKPEKVPVTADLIKEYDLENRIFEIWADREAEDKPVTVSELKLDSEYGLLLLAIAREGRELIFPGPDFQIRGGDMLLVQGRPRLVEKFAGDHRGLTFLGPPRAQESYPISTAELAEAVVPPRSPVIGESLIGLGIFEESGMTPLAYYRDGEPHRTGLAGTRLREGDSILVYGPRSRMREFDPEKELLIYHKPGKPEISAGKTRMAPVAALILLLVVLTAALNIFPIAVTALAGAVLMVLLGIVDIKRVYRVIDWKTLVLIGGMYPVGIALDGTGAADLIGSTLVSTLGQFGPRAVLGGIVVLTMILTQPMHNAAVAIIITPIAIQAASAVGSSPRAFCVGVIVACSCAFLKPFGHPAPMMVQRPGGYRQRDYLRFGLPLNLIALAVILLLVPLLWPL